MSNCQSKYDRSYYYKNIFLDIIDNSLKNSLKNSSKNSSKNSKHGKYPISLLKQKLIYPETVCKYINTNSNSNSNYTFKKSNIKRYSNSNYTFKKSNIKRYSNSNYTFEKSNIKRYSNSNSNSNSNSYDYFIRRMMYIRKKEELKNYNLRYNRYLNRSDNLRLRLKNTINIILQRKKNNK